MSGNVVRLPRHGLPGYFALSDLPQSRSLLESRLSTGWWELDQIFMMYPSQFVVVTGLAGSGKSTFIFNLAINASRDQDHDVRSWLYVPENEINIRRKLRAIYGGKDIEFEAFAATKCFIQSSAYEHYSDEPRTIDWILEHAYRAHWEDSIKIMMIDPWNELERAKAKDELLTDYIAQCIMRVKMFCRETGITCFMIAHPTKAVTERGGRSVTLGDIESSMAWYNKCDNGLVVERDKGENSTKVISAKVREQPDAGKLGVCHFHVNPDTGLFTPQYGGVTT